VRAGAELLAQLTDARIEPRSGRRQLVTAGLDPARTVMVSATAPDPARLREVHIALWQRSTPHISLHRSGLVQLLLRDDHTAETNLLHALGDGGRIGISAPVGSARRVPDAAREALWALRIAEREGISAATYGQTAPWAGISSLEEAQALIDRSLRPLLDHEAEHGGDLLATLQSFLDNQRSWQRTADALHIHRQTVLYRIHKVQDITGRHLSVTSDIAELWMGLQAMHLLDSPAADTPSTPPAQRHPGRRPR
jgi:PucR family transcriptional regulator, purine catabolism regulatory protein